MFLQMHDVAPKRCERRRWRELERLELGKKLRVVRDVAAEMWRLFARQEMRKIAKILGQIKLFCERF